MTSCAAAVETLDDRAEIPTRTMFAVCEIN
jgi:hypothetical protein